MNKADDEIIRDILQVRIMTSQIGMFQCALWWLGGVACGLIAEPSFCIIIGGLGIVCYGLFSLRLDHYKLILHLHNEQSKEPEKEVDQEP